MKLTIWHPTMRDVERPELAASKLIKAAGTGCRLYIPGRLRGVNIKRIKVAGDWTLDCGVQAKIVKANGASMLYRRAYDVPSGEFVYRIDAWSRRSA